MHDPDSWRRVQSSSSRACAISPLNIRESSGRYADQRLPHPSQDLPAGVLHEFITHLCYLALRFVREDMNVSRVAAAWTKHGDEPLLRYDDLDALVMIGDVHTRLRFTSHAFPETFTVVVRGTRGWVETDLFQPHLRVVVPRRGGEAAHAPGQPIRQRGFAAHR